MEASEALPPDLVSAGFLPCIDRVDAGGDRRRRDQRGRRHGEPGPGQVGQDGAGHADPPASAPSAAHEAAEVLRAPRGAHPVGVCSCHDWHLEAYSLHPCDQPLCGLPVVRHRHLRRGLRGQLQPQPDVDPVRGHREGLRGVQVHNLTALVPHAVHPRVNGGVPAERARADLLHHHPRFRHGHILFVRKFDYECHDAAAEHEQRVREAASHLPALPPLPEDIHAPRGAHAPAPGAQASAGPAEGGGEGRGAPDPLVRAVAHGPARRGLHAAAGPPPLLQALRAGQPHGHPQALPHRRQGGVALGGRPALQPR
mmetsp:Transcript_39902/g.113966  ORF Transcript_39902/g.113966 Transcript_39902/m.113966 type:complete len:312 (+) Transcript_39902:1001-1936(+)